MIRQQCKLRRGFIAIEFVFLVGLVGISFAILPPPTTRTKSSEKPNHKAGAPDSAPVEVRPAGGPDRYLRRDGKLCVPLPIVAKNPTVGELLGRLEDATGLKMTVAENLKKHQPEYGSIQYSTGKAFLVMELMESKDLQGGRWEPTPDGYKLVGISSLIPEDEQFPTPFWKRPLTWIVGGIGLGLAIFAGVYAYRKGYLSFKGKQAVANRW